MKANYKKKCILCFKKHIISTNSTQDICSYCKANNTKEDIALFRNTKKDIDTIYNEELKHNQTECE